MGCIRDDDLDVDEMALASRFEGDGEDVEGVLAEEEERSLRQGLLQTEVGDWGVGEGGSGFRD